MCKGRYSSVMTPIFLKLWPSCKSENNLQMRQTLNPLPCFDPLGYTFNTHCIMNRINLVEINYMLI